MHVEGLHQILEVICTVVDDPYLQKVHKHSLAIHRFAETYQPLDSISVLVLLWLIDNHDGAMRMMGAVIVVATENNLG